MSDRFGARQKGWRHMAGDDPPRPQAPDRAPGLLRQNPEWQDFVHDPAMFAPITDAELAAEGWPE